ncbi:hypothetical protein QC763_610400 [Podospora pseudopauciseta]|uniref:tyrosinase n=1 Tax=Podospora pseudopauciseta TaxID=2093780 RepID=A0ABR0H6I9_9PEZI|nr:hypothetical protein QC763_610400 [Podospora pseudopauciseta]
MSEERPSHVVIQGILPKEAPGIRREFSDWAKDHENNIQVSLFIRALQKFYDIPYTETLSYFQVAGIHGYPGNLKWDGAVAPPHDRDARHYIYCTHNHFNFPTWHRPYMVLFEETLWKLMGEIIEKDLEFHDDADKKLWLEERNKWRLPYWDWALNSAQGKVPDLFVPYSINIRQPVGKGGSQQESENVPNPLARFQVKENGVPIKMGKLPKKYRVDSVPLGDGSYLPWADCSGTSRWGIKPHTKPDEWTEGVNKTEMIAPAINNHEWYFSPDRRKPEDRKKREEAIFKHPVGDLLHRLFKIDNWEDFSSTRVNQAPSDIDWEKWVSLEYVHNNLHGFIGGDGVEGIGHMQNVPSAAFDPIFYMHHCNIDRITAMWQTLHEGVWFENDVLAERELYPFRGPKLDGEIDYFTSNDVRDWTRFGYQYEILELREGETEVGRKRRINEFIDKSYFSTSHVLLKDEGHLFHDGSDIESFAARNDFEDYIIDVIYDRQVIPLTFYALNGDPYMVHFFLGAPVPQPESNGVTAKITFKSPKHVGMVYNFSTPWLGNGNNTESAMSDVESDREEPEPESDQPTCGNCVSQQAENILSNAMIPLTIPLYNAAADKDIEGLENIHPDQVRDFLANELTWVAVSTNGTIIPWERLPKTKVFVLKGKAKHYTENSKLSSYKEYDALGHITHNKPAGASHADYGQYA